MQAEGKYAAYGLDDGTQNIVMQQIDIAVRHLTPAENRLFFGYDVKRRSYLCPNCYNRANTDWQVSWPALAQFPAKSPGAGVLHCIVCDESVEVERIACTRSDCQGNVIYEGMCLTCERSQDDPRGFRSGLVEEELGFGHRYGFKYRRGPSTILRPRENPKNRSATSQPLGRFRRFRFSGSRVNRVYM
jgi:hypothetical protein